MMDDGPMGPATHWLEAIRHEMAALVGLVSEVASRDLTPVVHVEAAPNNGAPVAPTDLQPLIAAIRALPAPVVQAANLDPLLAKLDEVVHVSRGIGRSMLGGGGGPSFITAQMRNEPGQTLHVTVDAQPAGAAGLTDTQLRATPVPVSGTVTVSNPTTNPETGLAKDVTFAKDVDGGIKTHVQNFPVTQAVSGTVSVAGTVPVSGTFYQATQPVSIATNTPDVTDRAARLLGHVTVDNSIAVTGPLTDTQIRATPLPVSGTVSTGLTQPLTDTQLRASAVPISATAMTDGTQVAQLKTAAKGATTAGQPTSVATDANTQALHANVVNFPATQPVSLATNTPDVTDRAARLLGHVTIDNATLTVSNGQTQPLTDTQLRASAVPVSLATNTPTLATGTNAVGNLNEIRAATTYGTITAAAAAGATLTLGAAGAGLFHYITSIEITAYSAAARTGSATPWVVTTTNITGSPAYTFSTAGAIGTTDTQRPILATPLKTTTANTATTIVAPAATGVIWRIQVTYFTAA